MGKPKQLLQFNGKSLLLNVIHHAEQAIAGAIYVVVSGENLKISQEIQQTSALVVENRNWKNGVGSSIACGIKHCARMNPSPAGILIMVCDQPFLSVELLRSMVDKFNATAASIVASQYESTIGTPALFSKKHFTQLSRLRGDKGAKPYIIKNKNEVATVPFFNGGIDIDTPGDYKALLKKG